MRINVGVKVQSGKVLGSGTKREVEKMIMEFKALDGDADEQQKDC